MKKYSKLLAASTMAIGIGLSQSANAQVSATATTTVDVNFPAILVLYTYSDIELTLDATFITNQTDLGGSSTACGSGGSCQDQGSATAITVDAATKDADIGTSVGTLSDEVVEFSLSNAFGARSVGVSSANYTVSITEANNSDVVNLGSTLPTTLSNTGTTFSAEAIPFSLDLSQLGASNMESEDIIIEVSGT